MRRLLLLFILLALVPSAGCSARECGPGTVEKVDPMTNSTHCVPSVNGGGAPIPCNLDAGARLIGGSCEGDPSQYPTCGKGTMLDLKSRSCVPTAAGTPTPPPCSKPAGMNLCLNGVVRYLKDNAYTSGRTLEVRAFDPFAFLGDPRSAPLASAMTDANGTYILPSVPVPGFGTIAVAVTDPGGPAALPLSGSGAQGLQVGGSYQVDLFAVEKSLVAGWDQQLGLSGADTFEAHGAYVGIFVSGAATDTPPVAGVVLTYNGTPAPDQFFFKGDRATLDAAAMATDAATGSSVRRVSGPLGNYSGMGGGVARWEGGPGTSVADVVFVQVFHPAP